MATDYEKKYKEALERARKLYNDAKANEYKSDMEDYESIFPELAESEDERIEDEILKFFCHCIEEEHIYVPTRFFDWLKKQKEQEHICDSAQYEEDCYDWADFRREAAKDILCAIISATNGATSGDIAMAIEIADKLIRQLKEEKK